MTPAALRNTLDSPLAGVRSAGGRQLDEDALKFTQRQIERRAGADVPDGAPGVLDDQRAA